MGVGHPLERFVEQRAEHVDGDGGEVAGEDECEDEREREVEQHLLGAFDEHLVLLLELHARTAAAVVVLVVVVRVGPQTQPAELVLALLAVHVVAPRRLLDRRLAVRTLPEL